VNLTILPSPVTTAPLFASGVITSLVSQPADAWGDGVQLFVADSGSHQVLRIQRNTAGVTITTLAGSSGIPGATNGPGNAATFTSPNGLWGNGRRLYVADTGNHAIRVIELSTGQVTTLAGVAGQPGLVNGAGNQAKFTSPTKIWGYAGKLYVADSGNHVIRVIDLDDRTGFHLLRHWNAGEH
jgi:hypothetical protein